MAVGRILRLLVDLVDPIAMIPAHLVDTLVLRRELAPHESSTQYPIVVVHDRFPLYLWLSTTQVTRGPHARRGVERLLSSEKIGVAAEVGVEAVAVAPLL